MDYDLWVKVLGFLVLAGAANAVVIKYVWRPAVHFYGVIGDLRRDIGDVDNIRETLNALAAEILPNGGSSTSIGDSVRRTERTIVRMEQRSRALLQDSPTGHVESDQDGVVFWSNRTLSAITGLTAAEMGRFGWAPLYYEPDRERVMDAWADQIERQVDATHYFRIIPQQNGSGVMYFIRCRVYVLKNDLNGEVLGFTGAMDFLEEDEWMAEAQDRGVDV